MANNRKDNAKDYECDENQLKDAYCISCINAKYKETFGEGYRLYICGKHKTVLTDLTRPLWVIGCKGKDFQRVET